MTTAQLHEAPSALPPATMTALASLVGCELGVSGWQRMDQGLIDCFAACTGDDQWIHVDTERAQRGPFGATIAHGWLTASLLAPWMLEALARVMDAPRVINYGVDRLRFLAPVRCNSRVRARMVLEAIEAKGESGILLSIGAQVELEFGLKPALVATALLLVAQE